MAKIKPQQSTRQKKPRAKDDNHLDYIRQLPCLTCGFFPGVDAAHIRFSKHGIKANPGMGAKPDDRWVVPLCRECHADQHKGSEEEFWANEGIDPIRSALLLKGASPDVELGEHVIRMIWGVTK
jgi:hypothetical protein